MVLVPATMTLLGRANWWLPGWLDRVLPGRPAGSDAATDGTHADPQVLARIH
jgi:RND superfamily putative drug exporter